MGRKPRCVKVRRGSKAQVTRHTASAEASAKAEGTRKIQGTRDKAQEEGLTDVVSKGLGFAFRPRVKSNVHREIAKWKFKIFE